MTFSQTLGVAVFTFLLTLISQIIINWIKDYTGWTVDTEKFKREHSYNQLKELYLHLYSVISQSEYLRYFFRFNDEFKNLPFIELQKVAKKAKVDLVNMKIISEEVDVKDAITEFNKINIATSIIKKGEFASQKLLKLAVAYRYVHDYYTKNDIEQELLERFQTEELRLIANIVNTVIIECNQKLKKCGMEFNENEIKTGLMEFEA